MAGGFYLEEEQPDLSQVVIVTGLFLFVIFYGFSMGSVTFLYIAEIVDPKMIPITTAANWFCSTLITILFPILTADVFGDELWPVFLFFGCWNFGALVVNRFYLLETKDKTERQIREDYKQL